MTSSLVSRVLTRRRRNRARFPTTYWLLTAKCSPGMGLRQAQCDRQKGIATIS